MKKTFIILFLGISLCVFDSYGQQITKITQSTFNLAANENINLGNDKMKHGDYNEAITYYKKAYDHAKNEGNIKLMFKIEQKIELAETNKKNLQDAAQARLKEQKKPNGKQAQSLSAREEIALGLENFKANNLEKAFDLLYKNRHTANFDTLSEYTLAYLYESGTTNRPKNINTAIEWYTKAANQNHLASQLRLVDHYSPDNSSSPDCQSFVYWLKKASERNHAFSLAKLGFIFLQGNCIAKDTLQAINMFKKAAINHFPDAYFYIGILQILKNQPYEAVKNLDKVSQEKSDLSGLANYWLGYLYEIGETPEIPIKRDLVKSISYYQKSAQQGEYSACYKLGSFYENGTIVEQSDRKAVQNYRLAAEKHFDSQGVRIDGLPEAQLALGRMYEMGFGIQQNYNTAYNYYKKAFDSKNVAKETKADALAHLGYLHEMNRVSEPQNITQIETAIKYYISAYKSGNEFALYRLEVLGRDIDEFSSVETNKMTDNLKKGKMSFSLKNYEEAFNLLHPIRNTTFIDAEAQYQLGYLFDYGVGTERNFLLAKKWYEKAAQLKYPRAYASLGFLYINEQGVSQDYSKAKELFKMGLKYNDADANVGMGYVYYLGLDEKKDLKKAKDYFNKAVELESPQGYNALGELYGDSLYEKKDIEKSIKYYIDAAERSFALSQNTLGLKFFNGLGVSKNIKESQKWFKKAAEQGDAVSMFFLGLIYRDNQEFKDLRESANWFKKAYSEAQNLCDQRDKRGYWLMGLIIENNLGVKGNWKQALKYYNQAGENFISEAKRLENRILQAKNDINKGKEALKRKDYKQARDLWESYIKTDELTPSLKYELAFMYEMGKGGNKAELLAGEIYQDLAEAGLPIAENKVGSMFFYGKLGVDASDDIGFEFFQKAASQNLPEAQFNLGMMYLNGRSVRKDIEKAKELFSKAALSGNKQAKSVLSQL